MVVGVAAAALLAGMLGILVGVAADLVLFRLLFCVKFFFISATDTILLLGLMLLKSSLVLLLDKCKLLWMRARLLVDAL